MSVFKDIEVWLEGYSCLADEFRRDHISFIRDVGPGVRHGISISDKGDEEPMLCIAMRTLHPVLTAPQDWLDGIHREVGEFGVFPLGSCASQFFSAKELPEIKAKIEQVVFPWLDRHSDEGFLIEELERLYREGEVFPDTDVKPGLAKTFLTELGFLSNEPEIVRPPMYLKQLAFLLARNQKYAKALSVVEEILQLGLSDNQRQAYLKVLPEIQSKALIQ